MGLNSKCTRLWLQVTAARGKLLCQQFNGVTRYIVLLQYATYWQCAQAVAKRNNTARSYTLAMTATCLPVTAGNNTPIPHAPAHVAAACWTHMLESVQLAFTWRIQDSSETALIRAHVQATLVHAHSTHAHSTQPTTQQHHHMYSPRRHTHC
jgi:hypothetical protein